MLYIKRASQFWGAFFVPVGEEDYAQQSIEIYKTIKSIEIYKAL
jgi:hypothetical protein